MRHQWVGLAVVLGWHALFGLYFETGSDMYASLLHRGVLTGSPEPLLDPYGIFVGLTHVFVALQSVQSWIDAQVAVTVLSLGLIVGNAIALLNLHGLRGARGSLVIGLFVLLLLPVVVQVEVARTALLLTGTSALLLASMPRGARWARRVLWLALAVGLSTRLEMGVLALVIVGLLLGVRRWVAPRTIVLAIGAAALVGGASFVVNRPWTPEDARYLDFRRHQFALWDYDGVPGNELDARDAALLETARQFFIADPETHTPAFFDRLDLASADKTPRGLIRGLALWDPGKLRTLASRSGWRLALILCVEIGRASCRERVSFTV